MSSQFVLVHGEMQIPPNYTYKNVITRGFPLAASYPELAELVEVCLNRNLRESEHRYEPLPILKKDTTVLYMMVVSYERMASLRPPFDGWGWMSQEEVVFSIPLLSYLKEKRTGVALFSPYCFVDNAWSMVTGNLLVGYQKGLATFQLQPHPAPPYPIRIATTVFTEFNSATRLSLESWIHVKRKAEVPAEREPEDLWPLGPVADLYGPEGPFEVGDPEVLGLLEDSARGGLYDAVQLLQVRDSVAPALAAYSEVVCLSAQMAEKPDGGGLLDDAEIEIRSFDSLRVAETLGLKGKPDRLVPYFPYWVQCDFDLALKYRVIG